MKNVLLVLLSLFLFASCSVVDTSAVTTVAQVARVAGTTWGFMGGSITWGSGSSSVEKSWVYQVANGIPYHNHGIPAFSTYQNINRIDELIALGPSVIFIDAGVNDGQGTDPSNAEQLRAVFGLMVDKISIAGIAPIIVDFADYPSYMIMINNPDWESDAMRIHRQVAHSRGVFYLNIGRQIANWCKIYGVNPALIVPDGTHPGDWGHELYALFIRQYFGY